MKSLFLLFAVCQLAIAAEITAVVLESDGNTANSCPSEGKQERAIQSLRKFTDDILSNLRFPHTQCGNGLWYQLIGINMSAADSQCPDGWVEENEGGVRACGRGTVGASCQSVFFNNDNHPIQYTRVCGRAIGYQYATTDAFQRNSVKTINQNYVDGLSITYGFSHQHLWTFAAGVTEGRGTSIYNCPCSTPNQGPSPPSYVGNNWYCESGNPSSSAPVILYSSDPLWDGKNCEGTCCSNGKSPPWFSVELPAPTNDYIEARICADEHSDNSEDILISIFEIFIQ